MDRDCAVPHNDLRPLTLGAPTFMSAWLLAAAVLPLDAQALGVGNPLTHSALGQPLNLLFPLRLNGDETLSRDCVRAEVLAGEARVPQGLLQFKLEADGDGRVRAVRLLSAMQIDEPIVTVNLSLGCPAQFTRQFTAFIDPSDSRPVLAAQALPLADAVAVAVAAPDSANRGSGVAPVRAITSGEAKVVALSAPAPVPAPAAAPAPAPTARLVAAAEDAPKRPPPKPKPKPKAKPVAPPAETPVAVASEPPAAHPSTVAVPRLRMDPLDVPVATLAAAASEPASAPATAPAAVDETLVRLQALETKLDEVRRETVSSEDQFKLLRAQLDDARHQRYQNVLVYGLGVFMVALAAICAYLWRSRQRERQAHEEAWWNEVERSRRMREQQRASAPVPLNPQSSLNPLKSQKPPAETPGLAPPSGSLESWRMSDDMPRTLAAPDFDEQTMASAFVDAQQRGPWPPPPSPLPPAQQPMPDASVLGEAEAPFTAPLPLMDEALSLQFVEASRNGHAIEQTHAAVRAHAMAFLPPVAVEAPGQSWGRSVILDDENHEVSVEELIDLEQQVDFFEVLGQDDAAIDLLKLRIATGQASALPYLKLLEIYQRRGEEAEFATLAAQFPQRFKAMPPIWGAKLNEGRSLESYGRVLEFIQQHWSDSGASMALLQNLLSHGGEDAQGFDLPAYRDLLMLYGLARDQSEREVRGEEIDLFLPLDSGVGGNAATSMMATTPMQAVPQNVMLDLHLDIDLDQPV